MPILRLEIPETCFDCPYKLLKDTEDMSWFCGIFHDYIEGNNRLQDCLDESRPSIQQIFTKEEAESRN